MSLDIRALAALASGYLQGRQALEQQDYERSRRKEAADREERAYRESHVGYTPETAPVFTRYGIPQGSVLSPDTYLRLRQASEEEQKGSAEGKALAALFGAGTAGGETYPQAPVDTGEVSPVTSGSAIAVPTVPEPPAPSAPVMKTPTIAETLAAANQYGLDEEGRARLIGLATQQQERERVARQRAEDRVSYGSNTAAVYDRYTIDHAKTLDLGDYLRMKTALDAENLEKERSTNALRLAGTLGGRQAPASAPAASTPPPPMPMGGAEPGAQYSPEPAPPAPSPPTREEFLAEAARLKVPLETALALWADEEKRKNFEESKGITAALAEAKIAAERANADLARERANSYQTLVPIPTGKPGEEIKVPTGAVGTVASAYVRGQTGAHSPAGIALAAERNAGAERNLAAAGLARARAGQIPLTESARRKKLNASTAKTQEEIDELASLAGFDGSQIPVLPGDPSGSGGRLPPVRLSRKSLDGAFELTSRPNRTTGSMEQRPGDQGQPTRLALPNGRIVELKADDGIPIRLKPGKGPRLAIAYALSRGIIKDPAGVTVLPARVDAIEKDRQANANLLNRTFKGDVGAFSLYAKGKGIDRNTVEDSVRTAHKSGTMKLPGWAEDIVAMATAPQPRLWRRGRISRATTWTKDAARIVAATAIIKGTYAGESAGTIRARIEQILGR